MQVVRPIDIEDALRTDLAAKLANARVMAQPIPPDLCSGDVVVYATGGARVSGASHEYDLSIDCYAANDADACDYANVVSGLISALPLLETTTQYSNAQARIPYPNYDPRAPQLARYTFGAMVVCPGERIEL